MFTLAISCLTTSNLPLFMDQVPWIPGSYAILLFTALDLASFTSHIHSLVLSLLWLCLFILSGVISPLNPVAYWASIDLRSSSFSVLPFCLFILFMGFSRQEYWSGLPFPSPVDHLLSELSTMTCPSWMALHSMAHSFIELDKAVIHVIRLVGFLSLWFSVCLPSDGREGNGTPLQYSCLENPMDGGAWKGTVHGVAEGRIRLSDFTFTFHFQSLEKKMATHSSFLAWRIAGTGGAW